MKNKENLVFVKSRDGLDSVEVLQYKELEANEDFIYLDVDTLLMRKGEGSKPDKVLMEVDDQVAHKLLKCL